MTKIKRTLTSAQFHTQATIRSGQPVKKIEEEPITG